MAARLLLVASAPALFAGLGVRSFRITGGEPLVRRGVVSLIAALRALPSSPEVLLPTHGLLLVEHLDGLIDAGLKRVNLSLDSLDQGTWTAITRREGFERARSAIERGLSSSSTSSPTSWARWW